MKNSALFGGGGPLKAVRIDRAHFGDKETRDRRG